MKHVRSMTIGFIGGTFAATALAAGAQQTLRIAPVAPPSDAALMAEVQALKTQLGQMEKRIAGVEQASKTTATKGFELQGKLSALQTAFDKHQHYSNLVQTTGGKQLLSANPTSPPTANCTLRNPQTGDAWSGKYSC